MHLVHCHVPFTLYRRFLSENESLWSARSGEWSCGLRTFTIGGIFALRSTGPGPQPQETCRVSLPYPHIHSGIYIRQHTYTRRVSTAYNPSQKPKTVLTPHVHRRGHFGRALEDSISSNKTQWPTAWEGRNPLNGNQSFATMSPQQRVSKSGEVHVVAPPPRILTIHPAAYPPENTHPLVSQQFRSNHKHHQRILQTIPSR